MSHRTLGAALVTVAALLPLAAPAHAQDRSRDVTVMTRNLYLGADLIPLATQPDRATFEQAAAAALPDRPDERLRDAREGDRRGDPQGQARRRRPPGGRGVEAQPRRRQGRQRDRASQTVYDSIGRAPDELRTRRPALPRRGQARVVRLRGADRAGLRRAPHAVRRDPRPHRLEGPRRQDVPRRLHRPLRPADAGRRRAAAARLGRRRRARRRPRVPLRHDAPRGLQPRDRREADEAAPARPARVARRGSRSSSATSTPTRRPRGSDRGAVAPAERVPHRDRRRVHEPAAPARDVLLRRGPADDDQAPGPVDRPHHRPAATPGRCGRRSSAAGRPSGAAACGRRTTRASSRRSVCGSSVVCVAPRPVSFVPVGALR